MTSKRRTGNGANVSTTPNAISQRQRQDEALNRRSQGWTYDRIAKECGWQNRSSASRAVETALNRQPAEDAPIVRQLEAIRLDAMLEVAMIELHRDHWTISNGRLMLDPTTGEPIIDAGGKLAVLDRVLKIMERRARMLGTDAPTKHQIDVLTEDVMDAAIRQLEEQLASGSSTPTESLESEETGS